MSKRIHIIGGGIIGLSTAWYLKEKGYQVTVIEKNNFSDSTSHGNAGMIVPSHFVPMASPGVIGQGIKWMFDSKSPFYVKPRLNVDLLSWLWNFYRSCNIANVERSVSMLYQFNEHSKYLYGKFANHPDFSFCFEQKGLLMLYKSSKQEHEEKEMAEKAMSLGIDALVMDIDQLKTIEPEISIDARGGVYFPSDAHLYPNMFIAQLFKSLSKRGVEFVTNTSVTDLQTQGNKISKILLSNGQVVPIEELIICTGSWSPFLLKKLGMRLLLQDGKGYSFTLKNQKLRPKIPTILTESKVAVTPMGNDLRIGGTLELGGMSTKINTNRLQGIFESLPKYYPDLKISKPDLQSVWMGYRPCTPDGLPYIGRSVAYQNLIIGTGHGMMGMSMGPATGQFLSQIVNGEKPTLDISLCKVDRW